MRIAMLGGSFNPIHNGHLQFAKFIQNEFALDKVLLMVASDPPHKGDEGMLPAKERFAMAVLASADIKGIEASDLELWRDGPSYTVDTLKELRRIYPNDELFCVVGADMLCDLPNWKRPHELFLSAAFIGAMRQDSHSYDLEAVCESLRENYGANVSLSKFIGPHLSSTNIRSRIYSAEPVEGLIPENLEKHIYENGYYMPAAIRSMQEKLKGMLKNKRYQHSMGTVRTAVRLAARYGADPEKTRLAALLHDCAKMDKDKLLLVSLQSGVDADEWELSEPGLLHAKLGAVLAERVFGVRDPDVLTAIRTHTTGRPGMTKLDKIIYVSDMIEPARSFPGVEQLRELAEKNLDLAVMVCMEHCINKIKQKQETLHPMTVEALTLIKKEIEKGG